MNFRSFLDGLWHAPVNYVESYRSRIQPQAADGGGRMRIGPGRNGNLSRSFYRFA